MRKTAALLCALMALPAVGCAYGDMVVHPNGKIYVQRQDAFLFGALAGRIGTKPAILCGLTVYLGISIFGYFVQTTAQFYMLAIAVAMVQGGTQALSRSLFASLIPTSRSSQFFGFFAVAEKFSAVLGPLVFSWVTLWTGSSRYAVLSVIAFFLVGGLLLSRVRVEEGQKQALESA